MGGFDCGLARRAPGFDRPPCLAFLTGSPVLRMSPNCLASTDQRSLLGMPKADRHLPSARYDRLQDPRRRAALPAYAGPEGAERRCASARRSPCWISVSGGSGYADGRLRLRARSTSARVRSTAVPRVPDWLACAPNVTKLPCLDGSEILAGHAQGGSPSSFCAIRPAPGSSPPRRASRVRRPRGRRTALCIGTKIAVLDLGERRI